MLFLLASDFVKLLMESVDVDEPTDRQEEAKEKSDESILTDLLVIVWSVAR